MTGGHGTSAPPLIVRVAGLPAEAIAPFSHPALIATLAERERLRERLDEARSTLVDRLHGAVRTASREERRFLLSVKRSCFNGGTLKAFRQDPRWSLLADVDAAGVDAAVTLESAVEEVEATLEDLYRRALRQEWASLVQLLGNRAFVRGVALSSPDIAQHLDRLTGREPDGFGRREKKLCLTLLRYASRAALKLSPFSTLTRTGLGRVTDDAGADFAFSPGAPWRERSTVSLRRELLEQCSSLLLRCRRFAEGLPVAINETLTCEASGACAFFRPGRWEFDDESGAFRYREPSSVRVRLDGPLVPWLLTDLREALREAPRTYRHLIERASAAFDAEASDAEDGDLIVEGLAGLLDIGFLNLVLPWGFNEPDLERRILTALDAMPDDAGLSDFRDRLRELNALLGGFATTASPARLPELGQGGVEGLFHALALPAGIDPGIEFQAYVKTFEEEVFLLPGSDRSGTHEIVHLTRDRMQALVEDLEPCARWIDLHSSIHDLLQTFAAFGARRWPGAQEVDLLEFFSAAQPLFNEYLRYRTGLLARPAQPTFNPLDLESVRGLNRWRERVAKGLSDCFDNAGPVQRLCPRALGALLDQVPAASPGSGTFCAFVQPLDPEGRRWVLNSINEGFGRFGSRFTLGMDDDTRARWTAAFTPLSFLDLDGEQVELVDMVCPGPRTINVHTCQTHRVLTLPGEHSAVAPERRVRLHDLRLRLRGPDLPPVLTDASARRLFPVSLGSLNADARPTLLKFLSAFGSRDLRRPLPARAPRQEDGVEVLERHRLGEIVYSRKKWRLEPQRLLSLIAGCGEPAAYAAVNRWRLGKGIPDQVFVPEPIPLSGSIYHQKPQYIDFSSPSFLRIFSSILKTGMRTLILEEALPVPEQFPQGWATEVQLESFAFRRESLPLVAYERKQQQPAPAGLTRKERS